MTTRCELCADITRMIDRHWPTAEIVDYTGMDTATLGRHLRAHGRTGVAATLDPTHGGTQPARQLNLPGTDYAAIRQAPRHDNTCPDQCAYCEGRILARDNG